MLKNPFAYLPPNENHFLASLFAFFHFILWAAIVNIFPASGKKYGAESILPGKSAIWITFGVVAAIFYIFILGPGIGSFEGHPVLY